jgi:lysophospholipase L1-like esterase
MKIDADRQENCQMQHSRELKIAATTFYASLFISLICCALLMWQESREVAVLSLVLVLAIFAGQSLLGYLVGPKNLVGWSLLLATLNLLVVVPELALRVAGFRSEAGIQFGYPRPEEFMRFEADERLFWKLPTSNRNANSLGFPGREITSPKPHGIYRVLFLGDSCTQQGYPDIVEILLNNRTPDTSTRFESVTLALSGYSSHQGRVLAEMYGRKLEPDVAVVYFGWNDHWQAYQAVDSQKVVRVSNSFGARSLAVAQRSRLVQGVESLAASFSGASAPIGQVRVPSAQYRENLLAIQKIFKEQNVPVVFISAPTSHYRLGVPDYLVDLRFVTDKKSSETMHQTYNQVVREVAKAPGSYLLDLEQNFNAREDLSSIFLADGIHFTQGGLALVAKRVSDFLEEAGLVSN